MAYISLTDHTGKSHRLQLKDIKDFRPLLPSPISLMSVNGCTIRLKDGTEIDLDMSVEQLRSKIKWQVYNL